MDEFIQDSCLFEDIYSQYEDKNDYDKCIEKYENALSSYASKSDTKQTSTKGKLHCFILIYSYAMFKFNCYTQNRFIVLNILFYSIVKTSQMRIITIRLNFLENIFLIWTWLKELSLSIAVINVIFLLHI